MNGITKFATAGLLAVCLVTTGGMAAKADPSPADVDLSAVDEDLQGLSLVAGGEVYDENLQPVATMDEYVDQFAEAGVEIPDRDAHATDIPDGLAPNQLLEVDGGLGGRGSSVRNRIKLEVVGCSGQDQNRSLQRFQRAAKGGASRGIADLRCGTTSGWGWRHIGAGHSGDYARVAAMMGKSWDAYAKWCLGQTLGTPSSASYQAGNQTYLYNTPIQIWNNGRLYKTYTNHVSVSRGDFRIITEYFS